MFDALACSCRTFHEAFLSENRNPLLKMTRASNEPNQGARNIEIVCAVFIFLPAVAVFARFWSKRLKRSALALDDWLIVASLLCFYLSSIQAIILEKKGGIGRHVYDGVSKDELIIAGKVSHYSAPPSLLP